MLFLLLSILTTAGTEFHFLSEPPVPRSFPFFHESRSEVYRQLLCSLLHRSKEPAAMHTSCIFILKAYCIEISGYTDNLAGTYISITLDYIDRIPYCIFLHPFFSPYMKPRVLVLTQERFRFPFPLRCVPFSRRPTVSRVSSLLPAFLLRLHLPAQSQFFLNRRRRLHFLIQLIALLLGFCDLCRRRRFNPSRPRSDFDKLFCNHILPGIHEFRSFPAPPL